MSLDDLCPFFPWATYSKKLLLRIDTPYCGGFFSQEEADCRDLHLAIGSEGNCDEGNALCFFWLVDKTDGVIVDARFQVFADAVLIGLAEAACELVIGKNYDQARRISSDVIEKYLRDKGDKSPFSQDSFGHVNLVVDALEKASLSCGELPLAASYAAPPITGRDIEVTEGGYPGWQELTLKQKIFVIDQVLTEEVRPYIEMDAGGVTLLNLIDDKQVIISYSGACTGCHSSTGATLSYIQHVLRAKVHPDLEVIPEI